MRVQKQKYAEAPMEDCSGWSKIAHLGKSWTFS